jgi:hypothetical protein
MGPGSCPLVEVTGAKPVLGRVLGSYVGMCSVRTYHPARVGQFDSHYLGDVVMVPLTSVSPWAVPTMKTKVKRTNSHKAHPIQRNAAMASTLEQNDAVFPTAFSAYLLGIVRRDSHDKPKETSQAFVLMVTNAAPPTHHKGASVSMYSVPITAHSTYKARAETLKTPKPSPPPPQSRTNRPLLSESP